MTTQHIEQCIKRNIERNVGDGWSGEAFSRVLRVPHHVTEEQFEKLVAVVLDEVPEEFWPALDNLVVIIEDHPPDGENLLGLYEGIPITEQSPLDPSALPDRISIFRIPHCEIAEGAEDLSGWVRETVFHELGHHLGLSEERLTELGWD